MTAGYNVYFGAFFCSTRKNAKHESNCLNEFDASGAFVKTFSSFTIRHIKQK